MKIENLCLIIGGLAMGGLVGWPSYIKQRTKAEVYESLFERACSGEYGFPIDDEDEENMEDMVNLSWICYCKNKECTEYLTNHVMAITVPSAAVGAENTLEFRCPNCDGVLDKISDPFSLV